MTEDIRIQAQQALIKPSTLITELPMISQTMRTVSEARATIARILHGADKRFLVITGPCSIHDPIAALEYARKLKTVAERFKNELFIVMRVYFEKPRTTLGWKGLISDPFLDGSFDTNAGLRLSRKLLLDINALGVPAATEFLDPLIHPYLSDLISWCAIGARTSESQLHREMASGLPMPVGFKNSTDGNIQIAIDAAQVATQSHPFLSIDFQGIPCVMKTFGNPLCHIVLRGSNSGPNFSLEEINRSVTALEQAKLINRLIIDCSHGNSMKNHSLQKDVIATIEKYRKQGIRSICGVMLESNLVAGKQTFTSKDTLRYGQSITDGCIDWEETVALLEVLAEI